MLENDYHQWKLVYVVQRMLGRPPGDKGRVVLLGDMWSAFFGLRDDGRVFFASFHSPESHAAAEAMFRRGPNGYLSESYCSRQGFDTGWVTDEVNFRQHCASLAATAIPDDAAGNRSMFQRTDLEGGQLGEN